MSDGLVRVRARIQLLSSEQNGRTTPLIGGTSYRPNHNFFEPDSRECTVGFIDIPEGQMILPGETFECDITFWLRPKVITKIVAGCKWRVQEGGKLVGIGEVLRLLD